MAELRRNPVWSRAPSLTCSATALHWRGGGEHEPIVDQVLFEAVQAKLAATAPDW